MFLLYIFKVKYYITQTKTFIYFLHQLLYNTIVVERRDYQIVIMTKDNLCKIYFCLNHVI